jgi:hypothetical protein
MVAKIWRRFAPGLGEASELEFKQYITFAGGLLYSVMLLAYKLSQ